jgi:Flp pilus assembly pilin Flp
MTLLIRFAAEDDGQDLIEYALLTAAIGFCAVAAINAMEVAINAAYSSWVGPDTGVNGLWETPSPQ